MSFAVAPIVEGHGDVAAVRVLLGMMEPRLAVQRPVRFSRSRLIQKQHLEHAARIAATNIAGAGAVLLIIDADEDCAKVLAPHLQETLQSTVSERIHCRVALAVPEFESWIVGGDERYGVDESDRAGGLKERIRKMEGVYKETADQPRLIARADLSLLARRSRSFRHLQKVAAELGALAAPR